MVFRELNGISRRTFFLPDFRSHQNFYANSLAPSQFFVLRVQVLALSLSFSSKKNKLRVLVSSSSFSSFFYNAFRRYYRKFSIKNVGELWETKAREGRPHFFQSEKVYKFPSNTVYPQMRTREWKKGTISLLLLLS